VGHFTRLIQLATKSTKFCTLICFLGIDQYRIKTIGKNNKNARELNSILVERILHLPKIVS
jgi:hypothetical protein